MSEKPKISVTAQEPNSTKKWILIGAIAVIPLIAIIYVAFSKATTSKVSSNISEVDWTVYKELDLNSGQASPRLQSFDGKRVRSPGFMVPLEDNRAEVTEYLLVPNPQACVHAPPPPSNQMIYVRMVNGPSKMIYGPVWVEGTLRVSSQAHQYGNAGFQIYGEVTVPYK
jgi:uncharacterized protein